MKQWKGDRKRVGVEGSLQRRVLDLCESVGMVLVDVRDLGNLSRVVFVFDDETHMTEVTVEDKLYPMRLEG